MLGFILFLVKFLLLAALYFMVLYNYAPSDVTQTDWMSKVGLIMLFGRIFGLFVFYRLIKFIFFSKGKPFLLRIISALFALPFYALISALIIVGLNGYKDDYTKSVSWQTNLIYFKNFKIVCLAAALDTQQILEKNYEPQLILLSGKHCATLAEDTITNDTLSPYQFELSAGAYSIPYITHVQRL